MIDEIEIKAKVGRPPMPIGDRLTRPYHVRFGKRTLTVAQRIADERFGGNISRGLRLLAHIGALAWESKQG